MRGLFPQSPLPTLGERREKITCEDSFEDFRTALSLVTKDAVLPIAHARGGNNGGRSPNRSCARWGNGVSVTHRVVTPNYIFRRADNLDDLRTVLGTWPFPQSPMPTLGERRADFPCEVSFDVFQTVPTLGEWRAKSTCENSYEDFRPRGCIKFAPGNGYTAELPVLH